MSSAITNLASSFPSSILSSLTGTVVRNAVTLELTPSKSRPGSANGEEVGFSRRSISPTGACPELGMGIHQGYETEATFHLLHSGMRVHVPGDVYILICPRVGAPQGPVSTHARTRVKLFNERLLPLSQFYRPSLRISLRTPRKARNASSELEAGFQPIFNVFSNSPAMSRQSKSKDLPPTVCFQNLVNCALVYSFQFFCKITPRNRDGSTPPVPPSRLPPRLSSFVQLCQGRRTTNSQPLPRSKS